jgi:calcyclin binding protein
MVEIEAVNDDEVLPSQERVLDAEVIEEAAAKMTRPTARMHLESLAKKLRRESDALRRVEKSKQQEQQEQSAKESSSPAEAAAGSTTKTASDPVAASQETPAAKPLPAAAAAPVPNTGKYTSVDRFAFDAGGSAAFVTLYVPLPGVGAIDRSLIHCDFTATSFDLVVNDLKGKSYRLVKDNLEKDIDPAKSKIIVKADKVLVKLQKIKQEYGSYDYWQQLTAKKNRKEKDDPNKSIMNLMKDMYDEGDDQMKKMIGETMMKQQRGDLSKDDEFGDTK